MKNLAVIFRSLQLLAHNGRTVTVAAPLYADHAFFGELCANYAGSYDLLVERLMGLEGGLDLIELQLDAVASLVHRGGSSANSADEFFVALLRGECDLCTRIGEPIGGGCGSNGPWTHGTTNLLAGLAEESDVRQFKIERRLGEAR